MGELNRLANERCRSGLAGRGRPLGSLAAPALGWLLLIIGAGLYMGTGCETPNPVGCALDSHCQAGEICDNGTGQCVEKCNENSCDDGERCYMGRCELRCDNAVAPPCDMGEVCVPNTGDCVTFPCTGKAVDPCPNPTACNEVNGLCEKAICPTGNDSECETQGVGSDCVEGVCLDECLAGECPPGNVCNNGNCQAESTQPACTHDNQCDGQICQNGHCIADCTAKGCPFAYVCDQAISCMKHACTDDSDCSNPDVVGCDPVSEICSVRCGVGLPPCQTGTVCNVSNFCQVRDCATDSDCAGTGGVCNNKLSVCAAGCLDGCPDGQDCGPDNDVCVDELPFATDPQGSIELGEYRPGLDTSVTIRFTVRQGDLQLRFVAANLSLGVEFKGFEPSGGSGTVVGEVLVNGMPAFDLVALDDNTAYVDRNNNGQQDPSEAVVKMRDKGDGPLVLVTNFLGGDENAQQMFVESDAMWELRIFAGPLCTSTNVGLYKLGLFIRSVDPKDGTAGNGLSPEPKRVDIVKNFALCEEVTVQDGTWDTPSTWGSGNIPGTGDTVCAVHGNGSGDLEVTGTTVSVERVFATDHLRVSSNAVVEIQSNSAVEGGVQIIDSTVTTPTDATLEVGGQCRIEGASYVNVHVKILPDSTLTVGSGAVDVDEDKDITVGGGGEFVYDGDGSTFGGRSLQCKPYSHTRIIKPAVFDCPLTVEQRGTVTVTTNFSGPIARNDGDFSLLPPDPTTEGAAVVTATLIGFNASGFGRFSVDQFGKFILVSSWDGDWTFDGLGEIEVAGNVTTRGPIDVGKLTVTQILNLDGASSTIGELVMDSPVAIIDGGADLNVTGLADLLGGVIQGTGSVNLNGPANFSNNAFSGRPVVATSTILVTNDAVLSNGATLTVANGATMTLTDLGRFFVNTGASFSIDGNVIVIDPTQPFPLAAIVGDGTGPVWNSSSTANIQVVNEQFAISGGGFLSGTYDIAAGATMRLQDGVWVLDNVAINNPGMLRFLDSEVRLNGHVLVTGNGTVEFDPQGVGGLGSLQIRIGGPTPGSPGGYDQLDIVSGTADLDGDLVIVLNGYTPQIGDVFDVLKYISKVNSFDNIVVPGLPLGSAWQITEGATEVRLEVVAQSQAVSVVVEPLDAQVIVDGNAAFDVRISNTGANPIDNLTVSGVLAGVTTDLDLLVPTSGSCNGLLPVDCNLGTLAVGQTAVLRVLATPRGTGTLRLDVTVQQVEQASALITVVTDAELEQSTMFAIRGNGAITVPGGLYQMNPVNGEVTFVADLWNPGGLPGFAIDPDGIGWATTLAGSGTTSRLLKIDLAGTVIQDVGDVTLGGVPIAVGDLAVQPITGVVYALRAGADGAGLAGQILSVDKTTGVATLLGPLTGRRKGGLAFSSDGRLHHSTNVPSLRELDPNTAETLAEVALPVFFDGLGYNEASNRLYGTYFNVWSIDPDTGASIEILPDQDEYYSDVAFLPGPVITFIRFDDPTTLSRNESSRTLSVDVIRGNLNTLIQTGGDFSIATLACAGNDIAGTTLVSPEQPGPGEVFFWTARANTASGPLSYNSVGPSQPGDRDAGIAASGAGCP